MKRLDLAEVVLTLKASGVNDVSTFRWLEAPDPRALERAETLLVDLGAIDDTTRRHHRTRPAHARVSGPSALRAHAAGRAGLRLRAASRVDRGADPGTRLAGASTSETDRGARDELFERERIGFLCADARLALRRAKRLSAGALPRAWVSTPKRRVRSGRSSSSFCASPPEEGLDIARKACSIVHAVQRCLLLAFPTISPNDSTPARSAASWCTAGAARWRARALSKRRSSSSPKCAKCESGGGRERTLNVLLNLATGGQGRMAARTVSRRVSKKRTRSSTIPRCAASSPARRNAFAICFSKKSSPDHPPADEAAAMLAREVAAGRLVLDNWDDSVEQWILRVNRLREWMPEFELPAIGDDDRTSDDRAHLPWRVQLQRNQRSPGPAGRQIMVVAPAASLDRRVHAGANSVAERPHGESCSTPPTARRPSPRASRTCTESKTPCGSLAAGSPCASKSWRRVTGRSRSPRISATSGATPIRN